MLRLLKKWVLSGGLLLTVLAAPAQAENMPVAVVEFDVMGDVGIQDAGIIIAEWMVSALGRTKAYDLKERVLLKKVLKEQELASIGMLDDKTAAELGKLYGIRGVVTGGVLRWGSTLSVTARLIDTTTGTILRTADIKVGNADQIPAMMDPLARTLASKDPELSPAPVHEVSPVVASEKVVAGVEVADSPKAGTVWKEPATGLEFVWIPGGCFVMGQTDMEKERILREEGPALYRKNYADEAPAHKVCVNGFWMGRYEVTNAQFSGFDPTHDSGSFKGLPLNGADLPVIYVSWNKAVEYASWLTQNNNSKRRFRLPTEAEWEYACRASSLSERFWGEDSDQACKYANVYDRVARKSNPCPWKHHDCDDEYVGTAPVGNYFPNPLGLYDMLGNVWEWTEDSYLADAYQSHERSNPKVTEGNTKVRRGGSWADSPGSIRCGNRGKRDPDRENNEVGFRLMMEGS